MKLECKQFRMKIVPENELEEAYLQEVFNLWADGDQATVRRVNAMGLGYWAYLEIVPTAEGEPHLERAGYEYHTCSECAFWCSAGNCGHRKKRNYIRWAFYQACEDFVDADSPVSQEETELREK